jgi:hypothetical protein
MFLITDTEVIKVVKDRVHISRGRFRGTQGWYVVFGE